MANGDPGASMLDNTSLLLQEVTMRADQRISGTVGKVAGGGFMGAAKSVEAGRGLATVVGAALQSSGQAATKLATGGLTTRAGIFFWVIGQAAYTSLQDEQTTMRREIVRRYQEGRLSSALYQRALGSDMPPPARYLFAL